VLLAALLSGSPTAPPLPAVLVETWNNPALSGRFLLVRNDRDAACYELPLAGDP
jgi:outer membrane protein assembly factor BamB